MAKVAGDQFSLAIGKQGQNVRLAARLTGWKIDVVVGKPEEEKPVGENSGDKKKRGCSCKNRGKYRGRTGSGRCRNLPKEAKARKKKQSPKKRKKAVKSSKRSGKKTKEREKSKD